MANWLAQQNLDERPGGGRPTFHNPRFRLVRPDSPRRWLQPSLEFKKACCRLKSAGDVLIVPMIVIERSRHRRDSLAAHRRELEMIVELEQQYLSR
jgi:hypothetical protein